ncbi:MAG: class I SAM-dependent methyltransferase [Candidatus Eisenbacteria sp.]|nr:class I SAM-dependent methyltransferase [Candidatus Eisenbacteria bacterium]
MRFGTFTLLRWIDHTDRAVSGALFASVRFLRHLFYFSVLGERGFQTLTDLYYDHQGFYAQDGHNRRGFLPWEAEVVENCFPKSGRILVTSCGAGREVVAFAKLGYEVVGTECHAGLCRLAGDLCGPLERAEIECLPPPGIPAADCPFDAIVVGWGGYTHLAPRSRRVAFLKDLGSLLRPGGPLLVSHLSRPPGRGRTIELARRAANILRALTFRRPIEPGDMITIGFCHCFLPGEAAAEAREAGLELVFEATAPPGFAGGQYPHFVARKSR